MSGAPLAELDELVDFDDELVDFEELLDFVDDELVAAAFFLSLPESRVAKNAMAPTRATTATMTAMSGPRLLLDPGGAAAGPGPGAGAPPTGPGGGAPNGCTGCEPNGCTGCTGCVGGTASVGGVAPVCCGGYHLPSDACHQPSPCDVSLMDR